jgi:hypothetical protein
MTQEQKILAIEQSAWARLRVLDALKLKRRGLSISPAGVRYMCSFGRTLDWLARDRVAVEHIMTDNGSAYRNHDFRAACFQARLSIRARPYSPGPTAGRNVHSDPSARLGLHPRLQAFAERETLCSAELRLQSYPPTALAAQPPTSSRKVAAM